MRVEESDRQRDDVARAAYIAWRMADLPAVYQQLLPVSCNAGYLWEAEKVIRQQHKIDMEFSSQPWRKIGPATTLLDYSEMTPMEKIQFGLEMQIEIGLKDNPKPGRRAEVQDEIDRQQQASPEWHKLRAQVKSGSLGRIGPDASQQAPDDGGESEGEDESE